MLNKNYKYDSNMVFLGGYPKSGTTLLCSLLDSHPELLIFPEETKLLSRFSNVKESQFEDVFEMVLADMSIFGRKSNHSSGFRDYSHINLDKFNKLARDEFYKKTKSPQRALVSIINAYRECSSANPSKQEIAWVEKTPLNELYHEVIASNYPNAKLMIMVRYPMDALLSHRRYQIKKKISNNIKLGSFTRSWLNSLDSAEQAGSSMPVHLIKFEDLVGERKKSIIEGVIKFLGIKNHDSLLVPTKSGVHWEGNSSLGDSKITDVKSDILEAVKLGKLEQFFLRVVLGAKMKKLGYERTEIHFHLPEGLVSPHGKLGYAIEVIGNLISQK